MIKSLTSLRGVFILFIFLHHCNIYSGGGTMAVAFFFVLSGFSLTLGYKDRVLSKDFSYRSYLAKRCIKFYPLHWITLLADIPLVLMGSLSWFLVPIFFINAALCQTLIPLRPVFFSFNAVSWFLADILFFAVFFPFILRSILKTSFKGKIYIFAVTAIVYIIIAYLIPKDYYHPILYISPYVRITDFGFGIYLALGFQKISNKIKRIEILSNRFLCTLLILMIITLLILESCLLHGSVLFIAPIYWPFIALLIIIASSAELGGAKVLLLHNKYILYLGGLSFTIFLVHRLVIRYTTVLLPFSNKLLFVSFCFILTIMFSFIIEKYLLNPITQWLKKRIQPSMTVRS